MPVVLTASGGLIVFGFIGLVMADGATGRGAENAMMAGHVADNPARRRPGEATRLGAADAETKAQRGQNQCFLHGFSQPLDELLLGSITSGWINRSAGSDAREIAIAQADLTSPIPGS
jgi:hypothetical protein